jgi:hypothetical protein
MHKSKMKSIELIGESPKRRRKRDTEKTDTKENASTSIEEGVLHPIRVLHLVLMIQVMQTIREVANQHVMMRGMKEVTGKILIDHLQGSINVEGRGLGRRLAQMIVGSTIDRARN